MKNKHQIISLEQKEIWTLPEVKNYLRISHDYDDLLINTLIHSAVENAESFTGLSLHKRRIVSKLHIGSNTSLYLPYIPILEIVRIEQIYDKEKKDVRNDYGQIDVFGHSLQLDPKFFYKELEIEYITGYTDNIPRSIQHGLLMHIAAMYDHTENASTLSPEIKDLYLPYRNIGV